MTQVRYGAREVEQRRNREIEATKGEIWSQALTAIYETDPEVIAAVLPRPLAPGAEPLVRVTLTTVEMPGGYTFGAGYFAVRAAHEGTEGEYPLLMPMTTEQATVGGRETFGEPKKIGEVRATRDGDAVEGLMARMGFTLVEIRGRVVETLPVPPERTKTDFYFKFLPAPDGDGFDNDPALVYCHKREKMRLLARVEGDLVLKDSPLDPIADIPVRRVVDINWSERATFQSGVIHSRVPAEWLLPFAHQRYDDLSVLGKPSSGRED
jgi:acetoacetate decarboxylase